MKEAIEGGPQIGNSARELGVRYGTDIDIVDGLISPGSGGMSISPDTPLNLPDFRRPPELGGTRRDPVWEISEVNMDTEFLRIFQDSPTHGLVEPKCNITPEMFDKALGETAPLWKKIIDD